MLKRIRMEASRKTGFKLKVIFADGESRDATIITLLSGGPSRIYGDSQFVWLETRDQLIIDGDLVP